MSRKSVIKTKQDRASYVPGYAPTRLALEVGLGDERNASLKRPRTCRGSSPQILNLHARIGTRGWSADARIRRESEIEVLRARVVVLKLESVVVGFERVARRLEVGLGVVGGHRNPRRKWNCRPKALVLFVPKPKLSS